jgi:beta-1,4-mannosyltransferase
MVFLWQDTDILQFYALVLKILVFSLTLFILGFLRYKRRQTSGANNKTVCVIVLGDIGRSPRMNYHALSFADLGYAVTFIGYKGEKKLQFLVFLG